MIDWDLRPVIRIASNSITCYIAMYFSEFHTFVIQLFSTLLLIALHVLDDCLLQHTSLHLMAGYQAFSELQSSEAVMLKQGYI